MGCLPPVCLPPSIPRNPRFFSLSPLHPFHFVPYPPLSARCAVISFSFLPLCSQPVGTTDTDTADTDTVTDTDTATDTGTDAQTNTNDNNVDTDTDIDTIGDSPTRANDVHTLNVTPDVYGLESRAS